MGTPFGKILVYSETWKGFQGIMAAHCWKGALLCLAFLFLFAMPVHGQWLSTWIEVEPTLPSASLRGGNFTVCDGGYAQLAVAVRGGVGPWRVELLRDGKMFSLVTLESR